MSTFVAKNLPTATSKPRGAPAAATPAIGLRYGHAAGYPMGKLRTPRGRGAFYRRQAELARRRSVTLTDVSARDIMLEVAKTLDALADIEERMERGPQDTADPTSS